jgi:predicted DsbA family dithiol-disulfide isomerase
MSHLRQPPVTPNGIRDWRHPDYHLGSLTTITLYHDVICPWCYVGWIHAKRLTEEFGVTFDWRGAELVPPSMEWKPAPPKPVDPNAPPKPPSRFDLFVEAEGIVMPTPRPSFVRSHLALLGGEYALAQGTAVFEAYNDALYRGYWEEQKDISDVDVLTAFAESAGLDSGAFADSVRSERYAENIVPFDDEVYSIGIRHVPTFVFNAEEKIAEAPYSDLAHATDRFLVRSAKFKK